MSRGSLRIRSFRRIHRETGPWEHLWSNLGITSGLRDHLRTGIICKQLIVTRRLIYEWQGAERGNIIASCIVRYTDYLLKYQLRSLFFFSKESFFFFCLKFSQLPRRRKI